MKKRSVVLLMCLFSISGISANAAPTDNSSDNAKQSVSENVWYSQPKAKIRVLNKLESSVTTLTIPVGGTAEYKTLTISVSKCVVRPENLSPDSAAFVTIKDSKLPMNPFNAWIFVAEPGVSVFEHPLYNVSIAGCAGEIDSKPLVVKPSSTSTTGQTGQNAPNDIEQSLERSIQSQH
ncbi:DUF2155 domain [Commensalibacter communis]|uniref:DUF2155 domain n=1 Tax=Commensalibacter communis TaxID=2972786 RepID=A0A9W4TNH9_9PROT|nr:DUF2155 domain-containing protein [Commensalibacter communis]CAI3950494.1 DUF2155 domain [Commensalibacter communis]CAI3950703.1 DUF2155 domain [Commensalibacter communis]CAI3952589.1 DUF2155 domain [Commensalibacter communis]CAI3954473.1 DUF2155 domain [Commensalibacter communis]CAI3954582.1 DUF2155 domain [Commensalibacter communis]